VSGEKAGWTKGWLNSLYSKLVLGLLAGFLFIALLLMIFVQQLTRNYQNEVEQKLHLELAEHIVHSNDLLNDGNIDRTALEQAFHAMMILGPGFEFYVLTPEGLVTTYSAEDDKIKRMEIDLKPVKQFISGTGMLPILGDDPRSRYRKKIFSVAEIKQDQILKGYLYIIIGGEIYDSIVDLLQNSHIIKLGFWGLASALVFSLLVVLLLFAMLTRPLRRLADDMKQFRVAGFEQGRLPRSNWNEHSADEIHRLGTTFNEMAATLKQQYEKVRTTDELRRELISYVSHDLRTPLAALQGYLETWQLKQQDLSTQESIALIQVAMKNAQQISCLVEQLFELAYLEAEDVELAFEPVSIAELAQDVMQKLALHANKKGVNLDVNPKDPSLVALADISKLERVFTNLIENAIRHCEDGGTVSIEILRESDKLKIEVYDDGVGINADDLPHIFDAHFRGRNSVSGKRRNGGLGLAITSRIIELHQSQIFVKSELGGGTRFSFNLKAV